MRGIAGQTDVGASQSLGMSMEKQLLVPSTDSTLMESANVVVPLDG